MKLELQPPDGWTETSSPPRVMWTHSASGIRVEIDPVIGLPDDRKTWGEAVIYRDKPPGGSVQQVDIVDSTTTRGWPATIASIVYRDAKGEGVEFRVALFFELLYYGGSVSCRVPKAEIASWEQEWRDRLLTAILDVDVDFASGGVDYLDQLYQGLDEGEGGARDAS